mmetsp:Transcript_57682/g.125268  ORF Transcript_57682/g.125268 Transcript_57682/m.125268 type:complete len:209 (-) Transcript_57682:93-719(-)
MVPAAVVCRGRERDKVATHACVAFCETRGKVDDAVGCTGCDRPTPSVSSPAISAAGPREATVARLTVKTLHFTHNRRRGKKGRCMDVFHVPELVVQVFISTHARAALREQATLQLLGVGDEDALRASCACECTVLHVWHSMEGRELTGRLLQPQSPPIVDLSARPTHGQRLQVGLIDRLHGLQDASIWQTSYPPEQVHRQDQLLRPTV